MLTLGVIVAVLIMAAGWSLIDWASDLRRADASAREREPKP
jgi:hypothetical protein